MSTLNGLALHYVGIAEAIGLDDVHVDERFVRAKTDRLSMSIDLHPSDPGYLRVLTSTSLPHPADPWPVAEEVTERFKIVKALVLDDGIRLAAETLADPATEETLPRADLAAAALTRAVDALLAAGGHIFEAGQLAGILVASGEAPQPGWEPFGSVAPEAVDMYAPCPRRGQHTTLSECWMCWADVHSGRIPGHAAITRDEPEGPDTGARPALFGEGSHR